MLIGVPYGTSDLNCNSTTVINALPAFATLGTTTGSSFILNLVKTYTRPNFPVIAVTAVYYNAGSPSGTYYFTNVKIGTSGNVVALSMNQALTQITFDAISTTVFPAAVNDGGGYAVYFYITFYQ
jgi:hypothetical protein